MSNKTKVSKEVADFIKGAEEYYSYQDGWKEYMIEDHELAVYEDWENVKDEVLIMKQYSVEQLKDILDNGYVVE